MAKATKAAKAPKQPQPPKIVWPADQVERRSVADLLPYARNARQHTDAQVNQLAASIKEWGWTIPVLVDEQGTLIAGHGRIMAAHKLEIETVPTMVARGWSDAKVKAYRVADNKLSELSSWDGALLALELGELRDMGVVELTGFSAVELDSLLSPNTAPEEAWQGMPEVSQGSIESFRSIMVHFLNQADVDAFAVAIGQSINPKTKYVWFPEQARIGVKDLRYAQAEHVES